MPIQIAIVEDDAEICDGLARIVSRAPDLRLACACRNGESALEEIPPLRPEIVIMDINLPDQSGIECTRLLKQAIPETQILIFTVHDASNDIYRALAAGASGYLLKRTRPDELIEAIRQLGRGGVPMTPDVARKVIAKFRPPPAPRVPTTHNLTQREKTVLTHLTRGLSDKEIASELSISPETVNVHLTSIYRKLHVRSRTGAVVEYLRSMSPQNPEFT